jgi:hypothetical protein
VKKLLPGQLDLIQSRFEAIEWSVQTRYANEKLQVARVEGIDSQSLAEIDRRLEQELTSLREGLVVITAANEPRPLPEDKLAMLKGLALRTYKDKAGNEHPMLAPQEFHLLSICRGTLDEQERLELQSHVAHSFQFVSKIPWPPSLRNIPEIVYGHHEKLDGSGYPRGLSGGQIPLQTRMLIIADIFDALTAQDRPYKRAVPVDQALEILHYEAEHGTLDRDLLEVFVTKKVYLSTATR